MKKYIVENFYNGFFNPLKNKRLFNIIPILYGCIIAIFFHSMYQSCDDWDMRVVLEGTAGGIKASPSNFSMYMTVIYGNILKFLYSIFPHGYWYDVFQTLFVIVSLYVSTLFVGKNFEHKSVGYKIVSLVVLSNVSAIALLAPQFTVTSGILGVSSAFSFFMIVDNYYKEKRYNILCGLYCIFSLFCGTLIRFNSCWIGAFYTGLLLLPFLPYKNLKRLIVQSFVPLTAVILVLLTYLFNGFLVEKDPLWNEGMKKNEARVGIHDQTSAWEHPYAMWTNLEDKLDKIKDKDFIFSKGDYRMLLTSSYLGDPDIYSAENLSKVVAKLSPLVSIQNTKHPAFRLGDYRDNFYNFFVLFLILVAFSWKNRKISSYFALCFFLIIYALNYMFRDTPYRVWYIFAFATFFAEMRFAFDMQNDNKNVRMSLYFILFFIFSFLPLKKQIDYISFNYLNFLDIKKELKFLDKNKKYIIDYIFKEAMGKPFSRNIFEVRGVRFVETSPLNHFDTYRIDNGKNFWLSVCRDENIVYLTHKKIMMTPWKQYKNALSYYIKEKYGKDIVFLEEHPTPNLILFQCHILTNRELWLRKKYHEEVSSVFLAENDIDLYVKKYGKIFENEKNMYDYLNALRYWEWHNLKNQFKQKYLKNEDSVKNMDKFFKLMEAEEIK